MHLVCIGFAAIYAEFARLPQNLLRIIDVMLGSIIDTKEFA